MVLLIFLLSFGLALFRNTFKYSLLPIFFALLIKGPCTGDLIYKGGDDILYQYAFISGKGLSDIIFNQFYHQIYLFTDSLDLTYLAISVSTIFLCILIVFSERNLLTIPYRFQYLYPTLSILPMILTGAIRQNLGYLVGLFMITIYISSIYARPKSFFRFIVPTLATFSFLGHLTTTLFVLFILTLYHFCFRSSDKYTSYTPFLSYLRFAQIPASLLKLSIRRSSLFSGFLLISFVSIIIFYLYFSFSSPSAFVFVRTLLPNLYFDFSSASSYTGLTLLKKFAVVLIINCSCYFFCSKSLVKYNTQRLFSLLDYFLMISFLIVILGSFTPINFFAKLMRISTFFEIASLFISSALLPRFFILPFTGLLFVSVYFSALAREDYLIYLSTPFLDALSFCTF